MSLILDASMTLGWCISRADPSEAALAQEALYFVRKSKASVPALWYAEIANTLLVFERADRLPKRNSIDFLLDLNTLWIEQDTVPVLETQQNVLRIARSHGLTAYDATYLELAIRRDEPLATFDRKLAGAARSVGVVIFGDT